MAVDAGVGIVLTSPKGDRLEYMIRLHFLATNNMAVYEALIHGLKIASELGARCLYIRDDSELVVDQVMKEASCRDEKMVTYYDEVQKLKEKFDGLELHHVLRRGNLATDFLAKLASNREHTPPRVFVNNAHELLIKLAKAPTPASDAAHAEPVAEPTVGTKMGTPDLKVAMLEPSWMMPFLDYLLQDTLPVNATEARCLARSAKIFVVIEEELHKRSPSGILHKCIPTDQGRELLLEIHADICSHHAAPRSLVGKAFRQGSY
ncbi:uncharacterized protein [Setaria viridis]|uniref:uncharacterized protein n=1 Tax=Setaria viridis TaxID=4556 RepID=UPI003B3A7D2F